MSDTESDRVPFGRYQLVNLLGTGGMARVYRAVRSGPMGFEKPVALKLLDSEVTADTKFLKALTNEARLGGQIHHRNIVEIYEFDEVEGTWYMAMELVDGWTLWDVLEACRERAHFLPATVVAEILASICAGLDHAHELTGKEGEPLNLVHRDLKPGNVMVSRGGDIKIMDFGIAKSDSNLFKTTVEDVVKGTPVYMSPEQANNHTLDRRSDIFSLGAILHELVTLQVPFQGGSLGAIIAGILKCDLTAPLERVRNRHPQFCPLLERMLTREAEDRIGSATEVIEVLDALGRDLPPGPTLRKWLKGVEDWLPSSPSKGDFGTARLPVSGDTLSLRDGDAGISPTQAMADAKSKRQRAAGEAPRKRRKKVAPPPKKSALPMLLLAGGLIAVAIVGSIALFQMNASEPEVVAESELTPTPTPAETEAPDVTPEATPEVVVEATPKATPRVAVATPAATPKPTPTPEPKPTATGTVSFNSTPWSVVYVDGREIGMIPQQNVVLSVGRHTVKFDCTVCKPATDKSWTFEVVEGANEVQLARF